MLAKDPCQHIIQNLLYSLEDKDTPFSSTLYIHEIFEGRQRCKILDDINRAYVNELELLDTTSNIVERIYKTKNITPEDEKIGIAVLSHYGAWTRSRLIRSLTPQRWALYRLWQSYRIIVHLTTFEKDKSILRPAGVKKMMQNSMVYIENKKKK